MKEVDETDFSEGVNESERALVLWTRVLGSLQRLDEKQVRLVREQRGDQPALLDVAKEEAVRYG